MAERLFPTPHLPKMVMILTSGPDG